MSTALIAGTTGPAVSNTCTLLIGSRLTVQTFHGDGTVSLSFKQINGLSFPGASHVSMDTAQALATAEGFPFMAHKPEWMQ